MCRQFSVRLRKKNRRGRDSNPRYGLYPYDGLANRYLQPLGHLSKFFIYRQLRKKPYVPLFPETAISATLPPTGQYCKKIKSKPRLFRGKRENHLGKTYQDISVNFSFGALQIGHLSGAWPLTVLPQTWQTNIFVSGRSVPDLTAFNASPYRP